MAHNPIFPGYVWRQAFDFPAGFFQPGDGVRADFRESATDTSALAVVETGSGVALDGERVVVELTEDQTQALLRVAGSRVVTNFVIERGGTEIPIGVIVSVPIVLLPTRPE